MLTIYGRNAVMEALEDDSLTIHKLHLSSSNRDNDQLNSMKRLAEARGAVVEFHDKAALSRISKNARQDQGVALDIVMEQSLGLEEFLSGRRDYRVLALDGVTNPQNLGMIIRSAAAGNIDAIVFPLKGAAQLSPLVIKASAGTLFRIPLIRTKSLGKSLEDFKKDGATVYTLSSHAKSSYQEQQYARRCVFVLGNESEGVSAEIEKLSDESISIPMNRGVESLNVAVTAALLAFMER